MTEHLSTISELVSIGDFARWLADRIDCVDFDQCGTPEQEQRQWDAEAIITEVLRRANVAALLDVAEAAHNAACVQCVPSGVCGQSLKKRANGQIEASRIPEQCPYGRLRIAVDLLPQDHSKEDG